MMKVGLTINGRTYAGDVEPRTLLSDHIRELGLTGTHVGCEHGVCGACTILLEGQPVRSCLMFAVQADGARITTVEGLESTEGGLNELQQAFWETRALQCGFCTSGFLISIQALLDEDPNATEEAIAEVVNGNLCRCTGYESIVRAATLARDRRKAASDR
jgi:aerobic-type carbon monoxide dehydrogenase small subunit (CoxS/CutS family)